jgi:glycosyltransferase involved in cell wall biosynthesis
MQTAVLIPAYVPGEELVGVVSGLSAIESLCIVVVDDGSPAECQKFFQAVKDLPRTVLLTHPVNMGKGAALKTGLKFLLDQPISAVVTADADGQHSITDILKVGDASLQNPRALVLGVRMFDKNVPPRSMFGNTLTRAMLRLLFGMKLQDTQTGLRAIPRDLITQYMTIQPNRYEYELEMLLYSRSRNIPIVEIPIETIYINANRGSHFKSIQDSYRVYRVLFGYAIRSVFHHRSRENHQQE